MLETILDDVRSDLAVRRQAQPAGALEEIAAGMPAPKSLRTALIRRHTLGVIAEIKRRSPSSGDIATCVDPVERARHYANAGASAVSVLTERAHFDGSLDDLRSVCSAHIGVPVLRKDFIVDAYQVLESRVAGADAVLLIVGVLGDRLPDLLDAVRDNGMDALVEVHSEHELSQALACDASIVGINNRDLTTFAVDVAITERLAPRAAGRAVIVSESGITGREDASRVARVGADAVLVGEALMTSDDIDLTIEELQCPRR